jgi:hypothetical protein
VDAATDQKLDTFLRLHEAAFEILGGVPDEIFWTGAQPFHPINSTAQECDRLVFLRQ